MGSKNRYSVIVEAIFYGCYETGADSVGFDRDQITAAAISLGIPPPRNLGDVNLHLQVPAAVASQHPGHGSSGQDMDHSRRWTGPVQV